MNLSLIKGNNQRDRKSKKELWNRAFSFFTALWIIKQIFISEFYKTNQQVALKFHYSLVTSVIKFTNMRLFCVALILLKIPIMACNDKLHRNGHCWCCCCSEELIAIAITNTVMNFYCILKNRFASHFASHRNG